MPTAIGQTIALACNANPTKISGSEKLLPRVQIMLDGYGKEDPVTIKKLPVQLDVPELLVTMAYNCSGTVKDKAVANLTMSAFYYLLRVGEYTVKGSQISTKQNRAIQAQRCDLFLQEQQGAATLSPSQHVR
jgi:hypothetical protein